MSVVLKITDSATVLEVSANEEDGMIHMSIGDEFDPDTWQDVELTKNEAKELIRYLRRAIRKID